MQVKNKVFLGGVGAILTAGAAAMWLMAGGSVAVAGTFSTDTIGLPEAKPSQTVELEDGSSYDLTASIVKKKIGDAEVKMLGYNGMIPGPLIKESQGAQITLNFKNETDVPTALHSHGVRMENAFDGVPGLTQKEIAVGGTFTYTLKFSDAGMYWYHPHVREDYAQELGLYGNYLVTPVNAPDRNAVNREVPLILDDILIEDGKIVAFDKAGANRTLMGRFGNAMLINGETDYVLSVKQGEIIRFYITNAANARPFNFGIEKTRLKLVGSDGGTYEKERWVDAVIVGPSERAVVEVLFEQSGSFTIQNKTPEKTYKLGVVAVSNETAVPSYASAFTVLSTRSDIVQSIDPYRMLFDKAPDKQLTLSVELKGDMADMMGGMANGGGHTMPDGTQMPGMNMVMGEMPEGGIEWEEGDMQMMNEMSNTKNVAWNITDEATGKKNMDIDWSFTKGEPVKIRIKNDPDSMHPMQHPVHFHGQRFLVVARDGVPQTNLAWKDTVLIKAGETVDIMLDTSNPGTWMAHCHTAEHLEDGMMMKFDVQ